MATVGHRSVPRAPAASSRQTTPWPEARKALPRPCPAPSVIDGRSPSQAGDALRTSRGGATSCPPFNVCFRELDCSTTAGAWSGARCSLDAKARETRERVQHHAVGVDLARASTKAERGRTLLATDPMIVRHCERSLKRAGESAVASPQGAPHERSHNH
jgi:hypothetical protein